DRLLTRATSSYTYDANGNRLTETGPAGTTQYVWDSRNRLTSVTEPNGKITQFRYDFGRNLITKSVTQGGAVGSENYVLDDHTNLAGIAGSTGGGFSVLAGRALDSHFATVDAAGQPAFGLTDALNSNVAV